MLLPPLLVLCAVSGCQHDVRYELTIAYRANQRVPCIATELFQVGKYDGILTDIPDNNEPWHQP